MNWNIRPLLFFFGVVAIVTAAWFYSENWFYKLISTDWDDVNVVITVDDKHWTSEINDTPMSLEDDYNKYELIKEYDISCPKWTSLDSFFNTPDESEEMIPFEEFYTLDIFCINGSWDKEWPFYKFVWDQILQKWKFEWWVMTWEWYFNIYDQLVNYQDGERNWLSVWYYSWWDIRFTWNYFDWEKDWIWRHYYEDWKPSLIELFSGWDITQKKEYYESWKLKMNCDITACVEYNEKWKATRRMFRNMSLKNTWKEFSTYSNWQLEMTANYVDGEYDWDYIRYYENGQELSHCNYDLWEKNWCVSYNEDWSIINETWYIDWTSYGKSTYDSVIVWSKYWDSYNWPYTWYYVDGKVSYTCNYINWKEHWNCVSYDHDWKVINDRWYINWEHSYEAEFERREKQNQDKNAWKDIVSVGYDKWKISYNTNANITYIDTHWNEFKNIWTITYSDNEWNSITMLDRNLWATESWLWENAYWYYFWFWNNYWFKEYWEINYNWNPNGYSWNKPYVDDKYNLNGSYNRSHRDLWWWSEDKESNLWNPNVNNWYMRQWPCPAWYHVPSAWEWTKLLNIWFKHEHALDISYYKWMFYDYYWDFSLNFVKAFKLPFSCNVDTYGWNIWKYRTSSMSDEPYNYAYELRLFPKEVIDVNPWETPHTISLWGGSVWWWDKMAVRCFKDEYKVPSSVITLSYETNWWTKMQAQTMLKWMTWYLPWYSTSKTWYILEWWYLDPWFTEYFNISKPLNKDTTLYAKWEEF